MSALIELKQQGKIRAVSNFPAPSWKKLPSTDASIAYNLLTLFLAAGGTRRHALLHQEQYFNPCLLSSSSGIVDWEI